ncbi:MAG: hypothetical protein Q7S76_00675 [bacterium]|nr:hypothetical protein [bacterium]
MTSVSAIALFSGAHFSPKKALFIISATMLVSDLVLGFHGVMWATYGSMVVTMLLGRVLTRKSVGRIVAVGALSSIIFYLLTNFAVWAIEGSMYPKTVMGLWQSYVMGLPFFRNSLAGDFLYTASFFGMYEIVSFLKAKHAIRVVRT